MPIDAIELGLPGAHVLFTGRAGGVSAGPYASLNLGRWTDDDPDAVAENRRRAAVGRPIASARQVHGTDVVILDAEPGTPAAIPEADGVATTSRDLVALVLTADCLPIALATPKAIAMVHAGWGGLAGGVLRSGVDALRRLDPDGPISAAIGPGAGVCCYEVGDDVAARFPDEPRRADRALDLKAIAARRLAAAGVARVHDVGRCTICEPDVFFSHRASGPVTGRQGGLAWRA
ncbi:MAG TPA: polyphenol oxidase family protein [Baekduia sp.]